MCCSVAVTALQAVIQALVEYKNIDFKQAFTNFNSIDLFNNPSFD